MARVVDAREAGREIRQRLGEVLVLQESVVEPVLVAILARGHVLIEGIPGTGKTLLARTVARLLGLEFKRIQFTNDLMPSDILGSSVWRPGREEFDFVKGPLFTNVVLADEINRTSPRTLSSNLVALQNGTVSVEGRPTRLADPFFVLATRNPIEFHGTYPVPEAALDRFLVRVTMTYPPAEGELRLYVGRDTEAALHDLVPVITPDALRGLMDGARAVKVSEPVARYAYGVVAATREDEAVALGLSPRAAISWLRAARARALLDGRDYVLPDDLKALARPALTHRLVLKGGGDSGALVERLLGSVPVEL